MKILALDSTAVTASVAIADSGRLLALSTLNNGLTHSETLLPMVEAILNSTGLAVSDIDIFACSIGPGSFTGVRIGASTIKGLAFGRGKATIGVSALQALAYNLSCCDGIICPVMNARRNQVYNALFECRGGKIKRLSPDRAVSIQELDAELADFREKIHLCGDGYEMVKSALEKATVCDTPELLIWQNGFSVARCALELYESGVRTSDAELVPTYLRMPQAERERLEKLGNE
jgi:tRNA threonylcarbamoyladenosine biosynthesis protein TsaB